MIVKKNNQWCVVSEDGSKNLGCYATKAEAEKRLSQVEYFKHTERAKGTWGSGVPKDAA